MKIILALLLIPALIYLFRRCEKASTSAKWVAILIVVTSFEAVAYFPKSIAIIPGLQPVHIIWLIAFFKVMNDPSIAKTETKYFFSKPMKLLIFIYILGFIMTLFGGKNHSFYLAMSSTSALFIYYGFVPVQIVLCGWMVMAVTTEKENMEIVQKSIFIGAISNGFLISFFYLEKGALSGGWSTYTLGRNAIQEGMGIHSNHISPICVYFAIASMMMKHYKDKILQIAAIGASFVGTVFTFSRMAWYALTGTLVVLLPKMKIGMIVILAFMAVGIYIKMHTQIKNRMQYGRESEHSVSNLNRMDRIDRITAGRLNAVWLPAIDQIRKHPIFGTGVGSRIVSAYGTGSAHNAYLKILLSHGFVGLFVIILLFFDFWKKNRKKKTSFYYAIIAMIVMGMVGHEFMPYRGNWIFWILYGMSFNEIAE